MKKTMLFFAFIILVSCQNSTPPPAEVTADPAGIEEEVKKNEGLVSEYKYPGAWDARYMAAQKKLIVNGAYNSDDSTHKVTLTKHEGATDSSNLVLDLSNEPSTHGKYLSATAEIKLQKADQYKKIRIMYKDKLVTTIEKID